MARALGALVALTTLGACAEEPSVALRRPDPPVIRPDLPDDPDAGAATEPLAPARDRLGRFAVGDSVVILFRPSQSSVRGDRLSARVVALTADGDLVLRGGRYTRLGPLGRLTEVAAHCDPALVGPDGTVVSSLLRDLSLSNKTLDPDPHLRLPRLIQPVITP